jgi:hypothetical protein
VRVFLAAATQWRRAGSAGMPVELDYPAVRATAEWLGVEPTPKLLERLRHLEAGALDGFAREAG